MSRLLRLAASASIWSRFSSPFASTSRSVAFSSFGNSQIRSNFLSAAKRSLSTTMETKRTIAAYIVIGDEILTGKFADVNVQYLAKLLFERGIQLRKVEIVGDDYEAIAESIQRLSKKFDLIFTSGGIGPTHDDITFEAIARATSRELRMDPLTAEQITQIATSRGISPPPADMLRMAVFPYPNQLFRTDKARLLPLVVVDNIWILPGVPRLFSSLLSIHSDLLPFHPPFFRGWVYTEIPESLFADNLKKLQITHPNVALGSYPCPPGKPEKTTVVTAEGADFEEVSQVLHEMKKFLGGGEMVLPSKDGGAGTAKL